MIRSLALPALLAALPLLVSAEPAPPPGQEGWIFHQRIIIHIARAGKLPATPDPPGFKEKHAPKCVPSTNLTGATIASADTVDFTTNDGSRLRARLGDSCTGLMFYGGFYLKQTRDGKICAGRDMLWSRAGNSCTVRGFRRLVPKKH